MSDRSRLRAGDDCHCKAMPEVTRPQVRGATVGMAGLRELFQGWRSENPKPDDLSDQQILQAIQDTQLCSRDRGG